MFVIVRSCCVMISDSCFGGSDGSWLGSGFVVSVVIAGLDVEKLSSVCLNLLRPFGSI